MIQSPATADAVFAQTPLAASLDRVADRMAAGGREQTRHAAEDFEAVFLAQMLGPMFAGLRTDGFFGGGQGEEMFRSLMINEYGRLISQAGGIGVADAVMAEMLDIQERSSP